MNLFQLVIKQMRQRALSTWLTLLSIILGVGLAVAIMILRREAGSLFGQQDYGYEVLVGKKGSPLQLVMNTVYHLDVSPGNIPYSDYEAMLDPKQFKRDARIAIPFAVGDTYMGNRIFAVTPQLFGVDDAGVAMPPDKVMEYRPDERYTLTAGKVFAPNKFEAVIGSDITRLTGLKIGDTFRATHGMPKPNETPDIHPEVWTVVGVLAQTHTASDRVVYIPLLTDYTIEDHDLGMKAQWLIANHLPPPPSGADPDEVHSYTMNPDGTFNLLVPKEQWEVSGIMVKTRGDFAVQDLMYKLNNGTNVMAVNPASTMRDFFGTFLAGPTLVLLVIAALVTLVASIGIMTTIYNSVSARLREIAILRALGATKSRVLQSICLEAGLIGLFGGILGIVAGHIVAAAGSVYFHEYIGQSINWIHTAAYEWYYWLAVVIIAVLAGLVPAMKAYRTPVATNLTAA